jgi:hypothetical protein
MSRYKEAERQAANTVRNAKRNFEKRLAKEKSKNSKPFYAYLKGKTKSRTAVGPLKASGSRGMEHTNEGMANILNSFFTGVFTQEGGGEMPEPDKMECRDRLENMEITGENTAKNKEPKSQLSCRTRQVRTQPAAKSPGGSRCGPYYNFQEIPPRRRGTG